MLSMERAPPVHYKDSDYPEGEYEYVDHLVRSAADRMDLWFHRIPRCRGAYTFVAGVGRDLVDCPLCGRRTDGLSSDDLIASRRPWAGTSHPSARVSVIGRCEGVAQKS